MKRDLLNDRANRHADDGLRDAASLCHPLHALALCAGLAVLAACGGSDGDGSAASGAPPVAATPPAPPAPIAMKQVLRGLVAMGRFSAESPAMPVNDLAEIDAHPGVYSAAVVGLFWSQLEPSAGTFDDSALTAALASIATYNTSNPGAPVTAKLRIFAGAGTPAWVLQSTGSVTFTDDDGNTLTVGKFWTPAYQQAWRGLQAHLATTYDASSKIGEVAITSCATLTGEPFILPHGTAAIASLHAAGYTDAAGRACLSSAPADYAAWTLTPLDYTFNPFFTTDSGVGGSDASFAVTVMNAFRASLGSRGVVANHGLDTAIGPAQQPIYAEFQALTASAAAATPPTISPLEFQTLSPTVDWPDTIALGLTYKPTEIEVWNTVAAGGSAPLSLQQLQQWAAQLR